MRERFSRDVHHRLPCVDLKDRACVDECPVDCIYEGERMLYIHPDECVDCGACEPVCPVEAIYYEDDVRRNGRSTPRRTWTSSRHRISRRRDQDGQDRPRRRPGRKSATAAARRVRAQLPDFPGTGWPVRRNWHRGYREEWLICRGDAGRPHSRDCPHCTGATQPTLLATLRSTEPMVRVAVTDRLSRRLGWTRRRQMYCR